MLEKIVQFLMVYLNFVNFPLEDLLVGFLFSVLILLCGNTPIDR